MSLEVMSVEQQIAFLKAENERLRAAQAARLTLKLTEKGGVSVYGLNSQYPVTLYREQWERLLAIAPQIADFIAEHRDELDKRGAISKAANQAKKAEAKLAKQGAKDVTATLSDAEKAEILARNAAKG